MDTFEDVFAAFGGPARFAEATGIEPYHAQTMKQRASIPPAHWSKVVDAARNLRIRGITFEALAKMAEERAARRMERAAS